MRLINELREAWRQSKEDAANDRPMAKYSVRGNWPKPESNLTHEDLEEVGRLLRETYPDKE